MKFFTTLTAVSIFALSGCNQAPKPDTNAAEKLTADVVETMNDVAADTANMADDMVDVATKTKAVLIYAEWCGNCKLLEPKLQDAQATLSDMGGIPGLEFVTLDFTDKNVDNLIEQAEAAGVGAAVKAQYAGTVKTGEMLLIDLDDQNVLGVVTKDVEPSQIVTALMDAVSAS